METRIFAHINILYGLKTVQKSLFILVLLALMGCGGRPAADCVREADGLLVVRFDNAVEDYLHTGTFSSLLRLRTDFPAETRILVEDVLRLGSAGDDSLGEKLRRFYADTTLVRLRADVGRKFGNFAPYERELREAFARLRRVCPDMPLPTVYTLNSAFRQSIVVSDRLLGISLDKYMGADYPLYRRYFQPCQRVGLDPSRLPQDCLVYYLMARYAPDAGSGSLTFLEEMLMRGKIYWAVARVLELPLTEAASACPKSQAWYAAHEREAWAALSRPGLLAGHDTSLLGPLLDFTTPQGYFADPYSRGVGLWIGLRIIDSYMKNHPDTSIAELLEMTDCRELLDAAGYQPA